MLLRHPLSRSKLMKIKSIKFILLELYFQRLPLGYWPYFTALFINMRGLSKIESNRGGWNGIKKFATIYCVNRLAAIHPMHVIDLKTIHINQLFLFAFSMSGICALCVLNTM